jgi:hypothetical protein
MLLYKKHNQNKRKNKKKKYKKKCFWEKNEIQYLKKFESDIQ